MDIDRLSVFFFPSLFLFTLRRTWRCCSPPSFLLFPCFIFYANVKKRGGEGDNGPRGRIIPVSSSIDLICLDFSI